MQKKNNITEGPISKTVISLAWPVVVGMFMEFALLTTDYYWVGKLGAFAQDAVTSSMVMIWTIMASTSIVGIGSTAIVARYIGAKEFKKANYFINQAAYLAIGAGLLVSVIGYIFSPRLLVFMGSSEQTLAHAIPYIRVFFISSVLVFINETTYAIFRASGNTKTPTIVGITVVLLNMVLDPLLIFGYGIVPPLGVMGASIASAIAMFIGMTMIISSLYKDKLSYQIDRLFSHAASVKDMIKIGKIGFPMFTQQLTFISVYWFLIKIVHTYGETAAAGMGIGNRMESFSYLTCFGFSLAASTMVGQNLGANKPERAAKCAWITIGLAVGLTSIISVIFLTIPEHIAMIFSDDPVVIQIASDYLIILGYSQIFMAIEIVLEGSFSGAGNTIPPMVVMIPGAVIRIPLAYYLCFDLNWGINGVWWTLTFTTVIKAMVLAYWFKRGHWKHKEL